jgi:hypothetical protein
MPEVQREIFCNNCGYQILLIGEIDSCPSCGGISKSFKTGISDELNVNDSLEYELQDENIPGGRKKKRVLWGLVDALSLFFKTGEIHKITRHFNKREDSYDEVIRDKDGHIVHECHEELSKHHNSGPDVEDIDKRTK